MNPSDILKYGHSFFVNTYNDFPEAEWETTGACGVWSVKDIIAHLASYEHMLYEILMPFAGEQGATPYMDEVSRGGMGLFNDAQVAARKDHSPAEVIAEYNDTFQQVLSLVPRIAPDIWRENGTLPWYGKEYSLDDYIVYSFYGHKREHGAQINAFRDRLK
jgi:hypothetical protein